MARTASESERSVADLLEQVGRITYGECFAAGLNPAQWAALRYFGRANRFSRTVSAFANYHGTTRGTASQTVKSLIRKGYLSRQSCPGDRRTFQLELTPVGRAMLADDPFQEVAAIAATLTSDQRSRLTECLDLLLDRILKRRSQPRFGVCSWCCHLRLNVGGDIDKPHECALFGQRLCHGETGEICANFCGARPN